MRVRPAPGTGQQGPSRLCHLQGRLGRDGSQEGHAHPVCQAAGLASRGLLLGAGRCARQGEQTTQRQGPTSGKGSPTQAVSQPSAGRCTGRTARAPGCWGRRREHQGRVKLKHPFYQISSTFHSDGPSRLWPRAPGGSGLPRWAWSRAAASAHVGGRALCLLVSGLNTCQGVPEGS